MRSDILVLAITLPATNIALETQWLEDNTSCWDGLFLGALLVLGSAIYNIPHL